MSIKNAAVGFHRMFNQKFGIPKIAAVVNPDKCTRCALCESACPFLFNAIHVDKFNGVSIDTENCAGCGRCEKACRTHAIKLITQNTEDEFVEINSIKARIR
jgi:Heterodisulfide reductase, subunit A and related polyferredoxins